MNIQIWKCSMKDSNNISLWRHFVELKRAENLLPSILESSLLQIQNDDNLQSVQLPLVWDFLKVYKLICTFSLPTIFGAEKWWQKCHFIQTYDSWLDALED